MDLWSIFTRGRSSEPSLLSSKSSFATVLRFPLYTFLPSHPPRQPSASLNHDELKTTSGHGSLKDNAHSPRSHPPPVTARQTPNMKLTEKKANASHWLSGNRDYYYESRVSSVDIAVGMSTMAVWAVMMLCDELT